MGWERRWSGKWISYVANLLKRDATEGCPKGLHALETLLESHIDKAFDKFTAWALRNAFEIPPDLEVVLVCYTFFSRARQTERCIWIAMAPRSRLCTRRACRVTSPRRREFGGGTRGYARKG